MHIKKYRKQLIFTIDSMITIVVYSALFPGNFIFHLPYLALFMACQMFFQVVFKAYDSLWRYAGSSEYLTLLVGAVAGFASYLLMDYGIFEYHVPIHYSLTVCACSLVLMLLMRFSYRVYRRHIVLSHSQGKVYLVIVGAGTAGVQLMEEMLGNPNCRYRPYCFFDDSEEKIGKTIHNIEIKGPIKNMPMMLEDKPVHEIIVAIPSASTEERREILQICSSMKCQVRILPDLFTLYQSAGSGLAKSIRDVKIEDLLGRETIKLDDKGVKRLLFNKVVMVTGGGGSIGSELCRQIARERPKKLILVDIYENNAYDIQQELGYEFQGQLNLKVEIASVRDTGKINELFQHHRPQVVFHAAAHKHVPLMEDCPGEAVKNNIFGTYNVAWAANTWGTEKFVLISTDKAVNPTSIMGASKRVGEMIIQSMKNVSKTEYAAVRFGNVLGSNGSVVPLFQRQIRHGGPVTITDKRIIRYFMTIPEAAQLVLQAGAMASPSEIYVLDMGKPVKILDLAENLIRLSGYEPYTQIPIIETGLRQGEKLYEELLMAGVELIQTPNNKIFIEGQDAISPRDLNEKLKILKTALEAGSADSIKQALKLIVPTYKDPEEVNGQEAAFDYSEMVGENCREAVALIG